MRIYSLGRKRGTWASALHCAQTWEAGRLGVGTDIRAFARGLMSGLEGPDIRAGRVGLDAFEMGARISGLGRMFGACRYLAAVVVDTPWDGCPGSWPDVRVLEVVLDSFHWFSSSMNLGTCPTSRASSGGSAWYLTMHTFRT